MAQTVARRRTVAQTDRSRKRVVEDVARETFCSTCSPRVGGNNSGVRGDVRARLSMRARARPSSASYPTPPSNHRLPKPGGVGVGGGGRLFRRLATPFSSFRVPQGGINDCRVGKGRPVGSIEFRVSPSPSKIPYGGFSPVRLQMDRQWRPSTTSRGLSAVHIRLMRPSSTPPQLQLPGIRDPRGITRSRTSQFNVARPPTTET